MIRMQLDASERDFIIRKCKNLIILRIDGEILHGISNLIGENMLEHWQ